MQKVPTCYSEPGPESSNVILNLFQDLYFQGLVFDIVRC